MFGSVGPYREGKMFGLVADDVAYLKVDHSKRAAFEKAGSAPFKPYPGRKTVMPCYEIPADVLEDPKQLARSAQRSFAIQV